MPKVRFIPGLSSWCKPINSLLFKPIWNGFLSLATESPIGLPPICKCYHSCSKNINGFLLSIEKFQFLSLALKDIHKMALTYFPTCTSHCFLIWNSPSVKLAHSLSPEYSKPGATFETSCFPLRYNSSLSHPRPQWSLLPLNSHHIYCFEVFFDTWRLTALSFNHYLMGIHAR